MSGGGLLLNLHLPHSHCLNHSRRSHETSSEVFFVLLLLLTLRFTGRCGEFGCDMSFTLLRGCFCFNTPQSSLHTLCTGAHNLRARKSHIYETVTKG